jgi:hypothetical protein
MADALAKGCGLDVFWHKYCTGLSRFRNNRLETRLIADSCLLSVTGD